METTVELESSPVLTQLLGELAEVFLKAEGYDDAVAAAEYANAEAAEKTIRVEELQQQYAELSEDMFQLNREKNDTINKLAADVANRNLVIQRLNQQVEKQHDKLMRQEAYFGQKFFNPSNLHETGPKRPNRPKLTEAEVGGIRSMVGNGSTIRSVANVYGVHPSTVSRIVSGVYHKGEEHA